MKLVLEGRKAPNGYTESLGKDSARHSVFQAFFLLPLGDPSRVALHTPAQPARSSSDAIQSVPV